MGDRIQICGSLAVRLGGERVDADLTGRQLRRLFVFLVLNRMRPVTRDELAEAVWGDAPPPALDSALNALVSKARKALGDGMLEGRSELRLALPSSAWVDYETAIDAAHRAESAVAAGDCFSGYTYGNTGAYIAARGLLPGEEGGWIEEARRTLQEVYLRARESFGRSCFAIGGAELPGAERAARDVIKAAPFRESGHALLMEALSRNGNVAEALRAYEDLRALLREELGIDPSPPLRALHARLLQDTAE
jgi:DNA-binding SARP family transcriptional activator